MTTTYAKIEEHAIMAVGHGLWGIEHTLDRYPELVIRDPMWTGIAVQMKRRSTIPLALWATEDPDPVDEDAEYDLIITSHEECAVCDEYRYEGMCFCGECGKLTCWLHEGQCC